MNKKSWPILLLIHFFIGLCSTHSTWTSPTRNVIGTSNSDLYPHLWGYWRWHRQFKSGWTETWSNVEPYLNVPYSGELYHVDWLNALLVSMLQSLNIPFILSVNIMLAIQWFLLGTGLIALGKEIKISLWGLIFGLIAVDCSIFVQRFVLQSGVFERINIGFLCLYLVCLLKLNDASKNRVGLWITGCIFTFVCTTLGSWHYAMFLAISSILIGLWMLNEQRTRSMLQRLSIVAIGCGAAAVPLSQRAGSSLESDTIIEHKVRTLWDWQSPIEMLNDFSFIDLWLPKIYYTKGFDILEESIYIGPVFPILCMILIWRQKQRGFSLRSIEWMLLVVSCIFAVLALGPQINLWSSVQVYSPIFYIFSGIIPYFLTLEVPWEYSIMAILFGALFIGILHRNLSYPWIPTVLLLIQQIWVLPSVVDSTEPSTPQDEVIQILQDDSGYVFDYPFYAHSNSLSTLACVPHHRYLWWGTLHERPIAYGIQQSWLQRDALWREINKSGPKWQIVRQLCRAQICQHPNLILPRLKEQGFSTFVIHLDLLDPSRIALEKMQWTKLFGDPIFQDTETMIFSLK